MYKGIFQIRVFYEKSEPMMRIVIFNGTYEDFYYYLYDKLNHDKSIPIYIATMEKGLVKTTINSSRVEAIELVGELEEFIFYVKTEADNRSGTYGIKPTWKDFHEVVLIENNNKKIN